MTNTVLSAHSNASTKARIAERDCALKKARKDAEESLANILLGEKLPLDIKSSVGEMILGANKKVTKQIVKKMVAVYPEIDIDPSPIRRAVMQSLETYRHALEEIKENYKDLS